MLVCVTNLIGNGGAADYKGLDINLIVPGSPIYLFDDNLAFFEYSGNIINHPDLQVITVEEYNTAKSKLASPPESPTTTKIRALEQQNAELIAADLDNKELIVALYEMLMGGE